MARRDRSQGFAFVYIDVREFLKASRQKKIQDISSHQPTEGMVINLNKESSSDSPAEGTNAAPSEAVSQIRDNLDRLQSLHHKLHAMLAELNQATGKKKR